MNPESITPVVLAWNEEANIGRCLDALSWAARVVVVDSNSTDATLEICGRYSNVDVVSREFDTFASQSNFGLEQVRTEWVLSLDADYVVPDDWVSRVKNLDETLAAGFTTPFDYRIFGRKLGASVYPPRTTLYRCKLARYANDGHAHRVNVDGEVRNFDVSLAHDDRKPLGRWFAAQARYAGEEADKLVTTRPDDLSLPDRIRRKVVLAPILMPIHCLILRRGIVDGWAGCYYAMQRMCAELMLSIALLDRRLRGKPESLS